MKLTYLLLLALAGWSALGLLGLLISLRRGRHAEAARHGRTLAIVIATYLVALLTVSFLQKQRTIPIGADQCFGELCFAVTGVDEIPGLVSGDPARMIRVAIQVTNRSHSAQSDGRIRAYLVDARHREWQPLPGLSGNRLTGRLGPDSRMQSQPLFRVDPDSTGLALVFTRGSWQPGNLTIADSDSLLHRPNIVPLGR
jgi:hypothetical protein